jgi:hypothetical protein
MGDIQGYVPRGGKGKDAFLIVELYRVVLSVWCVMPLKVCVKFCVKSNQIQSKFSENQGILLLSCFWLCDFGLETETCCAVAADCVPSSVLVYLCNCYALTFCNLVFIRCFMLFKFVFRNPSLRSSAVETALEYK